MTTKITDKNLNDDSVLTGAITDGTIVNADISPSAAISSSKISGALSTEDLDQVNYNIGILAFKHAVSESLTIYNLVDGIVDEFNDTSGVASTDMIYDAPGDYYTNLAAPQVTTQTHNQTGRTSSGSVDSLTVPSSGTSATFYFWAGGGGGPQTHTGKGGGASGHTTGTVPTPGGATFNIVTAGGGQFTGGHHGGGGGLTGLFPSGTFPVSPNTAFTNTILIAGGGGAAGNEAYGGSGGGASGSGSQNSGNGGNQNAGGSGPDYNGGKLYGGNSSAQGNLTTNNNQGGWGGGGNAHGNERGGGGSGYYGGGGGWSGGGGSGYIGGSPSYSVTGGTTTQGQQGNGTQSANPPQTGSPFYSNVPGSGQGSSLSAQGGGAVAQYTIIPSVASGTITSSTFSASSTPTTARIVVFLDANGETINTDIIAKVSRDGGSTYTNATLVDSGYITGTSGSKIYTDTVDISGQPSGTNMKYQMSFSGLSNSIQVNGVSLQWA